MPRAPLETWARTLSAVTGSRPRRVRIRFTVRAMSGAVSASVPSRSKITASITDGSQQVVHVHVAPQRIRLRERIVSHASEADDREPRLAAFLPNLLRAEKTRVFVGGLWNEAQHIHGTDELGEHG